jgi:hypothetical protein
MTLLPVEYEAVWTLWRMFDFWWGFLWHSLLLSSFFIRTCFPCLDCPAFFRLSLLYVQHTTQTSMPPVGFEPASQRPEILSLDRSATGIGGFELQPAMPVV